MFTNDKGYLQINITRDELDLDKTLDCGQAFRWYKNDYDEWVGLIGENLCILKQYDTYISTNLSDKDKDLLVNYFNLDMCYTDVIASLDLDEFAKTAYEFSRGIHILRQPYFETMVTFLMSSCNTMKNIRNIVNKLSTAYGKKLTCTYNGREYVEFAFPSLETLSKLSIEDFQRIKAGFRASYLYCLCQSLVDDPKLLRILESQVNGGVSELKTSGKILKQFVGIGDKVMNCILLFAGHNLTAFPIDTHIRQIIDTYYNKSIDLSRYKEYGGLIQQYMFYYKAFN